MDLYYNQLLMRDGKYQNFERRFVVNEAIKGTCSSTSISKWPLTKLRRLAVHMIPSVKATPRMVDVALGPSVLVPCIEENLDKFEYRTTSYVGTRLTYVDVYTRPIDEDSAFPSLEFGQMVFKVMVAKRDQKSMKVFKTLADAVQRNGKLELYSATVCKLAPGERENSETEMADGLICGNRGTTIMHVEYWFLTELVADSLIGLSIEDQLDVRSNPFAMPRGIGCFAADDSKFADLRQFSAPKLQFSAQYSTSNSSDGLVYVAFDGPNSIFRLDRASRRSIYDLEQGYSYHTTDFGPNAKFIQSPSDLARNCIVLKIKDEKLDLSLAPIERLLGIGHNGASPARYLGSKFIDHVGYELYERELVFNELIKGAYNLPILLEPANFEMPEETNERRFYVTYYVSEVTSQPPGIDEKSSAWNEPKFIELWSYEPAKKRKLLINRLEFSAFSWNLDVEPSDSSDLSRIFSMDACTKQRSLQTQLRFRLSSYDKQQDKPIVPGKLEYLRRNVDPLRSKLVGELASLLEIPRLSLDSVDVIIRNSSDLIVDAKVVELGQGLEDEEFLGAVNPWNVIALDNVRYSVFRNRHSLDQCKVDSLQDSRSNWLMYCKELASCTLFKRDPSLMAKLTKPAGDLNMAGLCGLYRFDWKPKPTDKEDSVLTRVSDNMHKIDWLEIELEFAHYEETSDQMRSVHYQAYGHSPELRSLDRAGSFISSSGEALVSGLRYTTMREEPTSHNMNSNVKLTKLVEPFKHCTMACQLDDYCGSFSICRRKELSPQDYDCVLSTMSLTGENLSQLASEMRRADGTESFELKVSTQYNSQVIGFKRDDRCSLHPKDLIEAFKPVVLGRYIAEQTDGVPASEAPQMSDLVAPKDSSPAAATVKSLEECARECHELSVAAHEPTVAAFAYCPFDSKCYSNVSALARLAGQNLLNTCHVYEKHHTQFYNAVSLARVVLRKEKLESEATQKLNYSRVVEGLSEENCARDCSFASTNCLAFDWCQFKAISLCVLHSIRSPMAKVNGWTPLLPLEREIYTSDGHLLGQDTYELVSSMFCEHFYLKDDYFEVRVQQLLSMEEFLKERDETIKETERQQLEEDESKGEQQLETLNKELNKEETQSSGGAESKGVGYNVLLAFIGSVCGCLGVLYGPRVSGYVITLYRAKQDQYHAHRDLGRLALANNLEL